MARKFFVGGNFKMNPTSREQKKALVKVLNEADLDPNVEVVIAPPAIYLIPLQDLLRKEVQVAAQNCYFKSSGAFTGEISPAQLVDAGVPYVILGHSERRTLFHETSELVAQKTRAAIDAGLRVILCVGETLAEREAERTKEVVEAQLAPVVATLKKDDWEKVVIAPAHADIRAFLASAVAPEVAESVRIIYGGSVTAANSKELGSQKDVDGFLVGGASLKPEFVDIINTKRALASS
ncbi:hypothetical protein ONZ51_g10740 [Trametes cubensis]|uniref:Triosephosphate isomerase n=1 Tax=Trametes cubensis TaxID=1111947 RepID=A0AAD7X4L5_9APHY|nr:hypothetical protein ONZ51_g10740 [Trametes cubensis]